MRFFAVHLLSGRDSSAGECGISDGREALEPCAGMDSKNDPSFAPEIQCAGKREDILPSGEASVFEFPEEAAQNEGGSSQDAGENGAIPEAQCEAAGRISQGIRDAAQKDRSLFCEPETGSGEDNLRSTNDNVEDKNKHDQRPDCEFTFAEDTGDGPRERRQRGGVWAESIAELGGRILFYGCAEI